MSYGLRHVPTPLEQQAARRNFFRKRGFDDGKLKRKPASEDSLRELGGLPALHAYRAGYRTGIKERERRIA
jgi:hypothetical protein